MFRCLLRLIPFALALSVSCGGMWDSGMFQFHGRPVIIQPKPPVQTAQVTHADL